MYPLSSQTIARPRRKRLRPWVIALAVVGLVLASGDLWRSLWYRIPIEGLVLRIHALRVREVVIRTEWPLQEGQVRDWLPPIVGRSILFVDAPKLIRFLEDKPWVKSVTIQKHYPDRIQVELTTKRPLAMLQTPTGLSWIDSDGAMIERVTPALAAIIDRPIITWDGSRMQWDSSTVTRLLTQLAELSGKTFEVSQVVFEKGQTFRIFFSTPRVEAIFSAESWQDQLPRLFALLRNIPPPIGQIRRINLVFPKKAIVSPPLSN